jgi:hypothetical protein
LERGVNNKKGGGDKAKRLWCFKSIVLHEAKKEIEELQEIMGGKHVS